VSTPEPAGAPAPAPRSGGSRGKADLHLHSLYSDGTASVQELLDWVETRTDLDLVAIADHERIDGALRALELHAAGDYHFNLAVGEEVTTRRGHLLALFVNERIPALRPLAETVERIHAAGGLAVAPHTLAPLTPSLGARSLRALVADPNPARHLDGIELWNPSAAGRARAEARRTLNATALHLPATGSSDAHVLEGIGSGFTWFDGTTEADFRAALAAGRTEPAGAYWSTWHNVDVYRRQLVAKARHLRHTLRPTGEWR
jgi:predicted metal-dependent phosphoesterase TrpH